MICIRRLVFWALLMLERGDDHPMLAPANPKGIDLSVKQGLLSYGFFPHFVTACPRKKETPFHPLVNHHCPYEQMAICRGSPPL